MYVTCLIAYPAPGVLLSIFVRMKKQRSGKAVAESATKSLKNNTIIGVMLHHRHHNRMAATITSSSSSSSAAGGVSMIARVIGTTADKQQATGQQQPPPSDPSIMALLSPLLNHATPSLVWSRLLHAASVKSY